MQNPLSRQDDLLRLVSILHFVGGGLPLLIGLCWFCAVFSRSVNGFRLGSLLESDFLLSLILPTVLALSGVLFFLSGDFVRQRVNREASLFASILMLPFFPIGTSFGIFSLWVLTAPATKTLYAAPPETI